MILYRPKHKKTIRERLDNSILHDELQSIDVYVGLSLYEPEQLLDMIRSDDTCKPMAYYQDEIYLMKYGSLSLLLFVVFVYTLTI